MMSAEDLKADPYVAGQPESLPFWLAAERGEFLGKRCMDCAKFHWYPRCLCPFCGSGRTEWTPLSGKGRLYAFSTLRRAQPPYTVAYVELAEGPRMLTRMVDVDPALLRIAMPVQAAFERTGDGRKIPVFRVAAD